MKTKVDKDVKKHVEQMTLEEKHRLLIETQMVRYWKFLPYTNKRMKGRHIRKKHVIDAVRNGSLIEYSLKDGYSRLLFRSKRSFKGNHICVIVEPKNGLIVTAFYNHVKDRHKTMDWSNYNSKIDALKLFKKY